MKQVQKVWGFTSINLPLSALMELSTILSFSMAGSRIHLWVCHLTWHPNSIPEFLNHQLVLAEYGEIQLSSSIEPLSQAVFRAATFVASHCQASTTPCGRHTAPDVDMTTYNYPTQECGEMGKKWAIYLSFFSASFAWWFQTFAEILLCCNGWHSCDRNTVQRKRSISSLITAPHVTCINMHI